MRLTDGFEVTPSGKVSLALKPGNRFQIFMAGIFDFDGAGTDDFSVSPDLRIGFRL